MELEGGGGGIVFVRCSVFVCRLASLTFVWCEITVSFGGLFRFLADLTGRTLYHCGRVSESAVVFVVTGLCAP